MSMLNSHMLASNQFVKFVARCVSLRHTVTRFAAVPLVALPLAAGTPVAHAERPLARLEPAHGTYFGVNLDWSHDTPTDFNQRLGMQAAVYVQFMRFPLEPDEEVYLDEFVQQVGDQHGIGLLTLEPSIALDSITPEMAQQLADKLGAYNRAGVPLIVRFAHEMNGSWYSWGQQPVAYVQAFRMVAQAVHETAPQTAMLWAPSYGGGYPFTGGTYAAAPGSADYDALDTNRDGVVDQYDDPYAPYYPGDDAVDWVGMTMYHWGESYPWGNNVVPEPGKFAAQITGKYTGTAGDQSMLPNFYEMYAVGRGKPMAIPETSAFYNTTVSGDSELDIKRDWWRQVYSSAVLDQFPAIKMINWFEWRKPEAEAKGAIVDWTLTSDPAQAAEFRADLPRDRFVFAPDLPAQPASA
jgi:hypothetical protein